jgi:hypothetical protein
MGLFSRLKGAPNCITSAPEVSWHEPATTVSAHLFGGDEDLEIVGEASYQEALWAICAGVKGDPNPAQDHRRSRA